MNQRRGRLINVCIVFSRLTALTTIPSILINTTFDCRSHLSKFNNQA